MNRFLLPLLAGFVMLAGCGESTPSTETPATGDTTAPGTGGASGAPAATSERPRGFEPIDPATGTLALEATGEQAGTWTFQDVNGSISEQAGGGETRTHLQLESHSDPVHFKIRLTSADGDIRPGRYSIGSAERPADATYENAGVYYKAVGDAQGTVNLTTYSTDRAVGTYDLTLETLTEPKKTAKVKGSFDMRVQR